MTTTFERSVRIAASVETVWAFHERPDALQLLLPPWEKVELEVPPASLVTGTRVVARVRVAPLVWLRSEFVHVEYERLKVFADQQVRGPFKSYLHRHLFEPDGDGATRLTDRICYELPAGALGQALGGGLVRRRLERMFEFRHRVTRERCEAGVVS